MENIIIDLSETIPAPPPTPAGNYRDWFPIPDPDPVTEHISTTLWDQAIAPLNWQAARLSKAVYLYQEISTGWKIIAKFHVQKNSKDAVRHSEHEYHRTRRAWEYLQADLHNRAVQPLGVWGGVLFLEFIHGLTLEEKIAIRRSHPGELFRSLSTAGKLLNCFHTISLHQKTSPDFGPAADDAFKIIDNLAKYGVLQNHPAVQSELSRLIKKWATSSLMWDFPQILNHGDLTTTNIIFQPDQGAVAIDLERSEYNDPAADLGRLMAEVIHSVNQSGGNFSEGISFANALAVSYCRDASLYRDSEKLVHRAKFYQASSTLRIARNGWLPLKDRLDLVLQAFALLSEDDDI